MKNVGFIDRTLRFLLGLFLLWFGFIARDGIQGDIPGILIGLTALLPFYMTLTASCFVFRWFNIHSLTKVEVARFGDPRSNNGN